MGHSIQLNKCLPWDRRRFSGAATQSWTERTGSLKRGLEPVREECALETSKFQVHSLQMRSGVADAMRTEDSWREAES